MTDESRDGSLLERLPPVNWFGLVAGALMLILLFMGAWWRVVAGTGALKIAFSPFHYEVVFAGQELTSPLANYFILAAKLVVLAGGVLMIAGSLTATRWWGRKLVRWGAMRVFWMLVVLILLVVLGALFTNRFLPSLLSGMIGENAPLQFALPYLIGTGHATVVADSAVTISAPVHASLTSSFWLAVATAGFGIGARVYHGKLMDRFGISEEGKKEGSKEPESSKEK